MRMYKCTFIRMRCPVDLTTIQDVTSCQYSLGLDDIDNNSCFGIFRLNGDT